jgi:hypothetical protein
VVQTFPSSHAGGGPPTHAPAVQVSLVVHVFPSLQAAVLLKCTQPLFGLHESSVQTLPSLQLGGGPPTHEPKAQVSLVVHAFPSSHGTALLVNTHTPPWQESSVHGLKSLHWLLWLHSMQPGMGVPTHVPLEQTSPLVHGCPSLHELVLLTC